MNRFGDILTHENQVHILDSATKYPSIPTYHVLDNKGRLTEELSVVFGDEFVITEKVDGCNSRVIVFPNGSFIIGSREELLYASGDFIRNKTLGIVDTLLSGWFLGSNLFPIKWEEYASPDEIVVYFTEVYGHGVGSASKNYTGNTKRKSFRLFDVLRIPLSKLNSIFSMKRESVAAWREQGGQSFDRFSKIKQLGLPVVPEISFSGQIPRDTGSCLDFMKNLIGDTLCSLDDEFSGKSEGIVIRNNERSIIAKLRFEDYRKI